VVPEFDRRLGMRLLLLGLVVGLGCAAPPNPPPKKVDPAPATAGVTAPPTPGGRIKDSVPERSAALNAADRDLNQGATEQRFGFDEARARREAAKKADAGAGEPAPGSNGSLISPPRQ
jgi:hypothetical protein